MHRITALTGCIGLPCSAVLLGQDAMQYGVKHLKVLAEDDKVRVLEYSPKQGDKTPMHSHPSSVVYVLKGGRVKYTSATPQDRGGRLVPRLGLIIKS